MEKEQVIRHLKKGIINTKVNFMAKILTEHETERFYAVIMAGGGGTRLWPWSRREQPKQMLRISGDRSMFQLTIDRISELIHKDNMLVITT